MADSTAETTETEANGRFKPGASGNPAGRPSGAKNKTTLLAEAAMAEKVGIVVDALIDRASAGNAAAMRQFLDRMMPVPRGCCRFELPNMRGPRGIADAQEALIIAVAAGQVPPRDAGHVMNLIDRFAQTLNAEKNKVWLEAHNAERERKAAAKAAPPPAPAPAAVEEDRAVTGPDLDAYAKMSWPQLIDAMWDAEEAERKAASVPAKTESTAAQPMDGDDPDRLEIATAPAGHANRDNNREIQVGDALRPVRSSDRQRPEPTAAFGAPSHGLPDDHRVPQPSVDMTVEAPSPQLVAARARYRALIKERAKCFV